MTGSRNTSETLPGSRTICELSVVCSDGHPSGPERACLQVPAYGLSASLEILTPQRSRGCTLKGPNDQIPSGGLGHESRTPKVTGEVLEGAITR